MLRKSNVSKSVVVGLLVLASSVLTGLLSTRTASGRESENPAESIARSAGTTIVHGGTGSPGFIPVITTIAFHAERSNGGATGEFDCLAFAPEATNGPQSGQLTVKVMYVVGKITGASVHEDTVTLTGVADITGLGAGTTRALMFRLSSSLTGAGRELPRF